VARAGGEARREIAAASAWMAALRGKTENYRGLFRSPRSALNTRGGLNLSSPALRPAGCGAAFDGGKDKRPGGISPSLCFPNRARSLPCQALFDLGKTKRPAQVADRGFSKSRIAGVRQQFFYPAHRLRRAMPKQTAWCDSAELVLPEQDPSMERVTRR
jgi:hypothetical protein